MKDSAVFNAFTSIVKEPLLVLPAPLTRLKLAVSLVSGSVADKVPTVVPEAWFSEMELDDRAMDSGASFVAVTLTVLSAVELESVPSLTSHTMVRFEVFGSLEVFEYRTARSAACHSMSVAVDPEELNESSPLLESKDAEILPIVLPSLVKDNTSSEE